MTFAVIRVFQDYDYVEGAECVCSFPTQTEADNYVQEMKAKQDAAWLARIAYIDKFVNEIELPKTDYKGWLEFLHKSPFGPNTRYVFPKDFHKELKPFLVNRHGFDVIFDRGFNPPVANRNGDNLFVVEIK